MNIIDDIKLQYKIGGVANRLIYWNVAVFLISLIFFFQFNLGVFTYPNWILLSSNPDEVLHFPYTLLTYAFLHSGFWHLFFNMSVLNFSSRLFLTFFTQKQFLGLYLLSAIFAGMAFVLGYYFLHLNATLVGASAAVMAILVAATTYQPLMQIRLFLIGTIKLWHLTAVILLLDAMQVLTENTGGHIAHLAGAFFGFLYIKLLVNGIDLSTNVTRVLDFFVNLFQPSKRTPFKKVHVNPKKPATKTASKIVMKDKHQQQIDEILDKISQSGYDALTAEEKEFLFKAGK
ncbi:rhomboid family intramembrane serine protease [Flavobacterium sp.]|uniref:rhomboid family intramembrane serine protease n=1 Tax=Flavobacterium sp. TaxID=239 RepID=UPI0038D04FC9